MELQTCEFEGCEIIFKPRSNKKFCGKTCTKAAKRQADKQSQTDEPSLAPVSWSERRENMEVFELSSRLAETYYGLLTNKERFEFCNNLILLVIAGNNKLRRALTCPDLLKPCSKRSRLLYGDISYLSMAEIVNNFAINSAWANRSITIFKIKPKAPASMEEIDMSYMDTRRLYIRSKIKPLTMEEVTAGMDGRPQWLQEYFMQIVEPSSLSLQEAA
jgi:hypothetical protein